MEDKEIDILIVGSGAGGLTAAITAHEQGGDVLVIEKSDLYGGTSATSGGGIWIPCNHLMQVHGENDTREAALTYLKACIGETVSEARLSQYVDQAPRMLKFMEERSEVKFVATPYADYFPDRPGGKDGYRTLDPLPISATKLGEEFFNIRPPHPQTVFGGFTLTIAEAQKLITRSRGWQWIMARLTLAYRLDIPFRRKTKRHRRLCLGNALIARCLKSVFARNIPIWRNAALLSLIKENGAVTGAILEKDGEEVKIRARRGVIIAAGGFESNAEMRAYHLPGPTDTEWSGTPGTNEGDGHKAAEAVGVALDLMDAAWWGPSVRVPGHDRAIILFAERALPGVYIINGKGERFLNEAASYDEVGRMLQAHPHDSWIIFDRHVREKYAIGPLYPAQVMPDSALSPALKTIVKMSKTVTGLAEQIGVDAAGLQATVTKVASFAKSGIDADFNKGGNSYDRYYGDPTVEPNPCLGPLSRGPFYAFQIRPGDIGTKGGITVDVNAQALDTAGAPVIGLYATGNSAASVMGRSYPGAGSTIGPAMTFGYVAAKHAMGVNE